ncbi:hypothetical protein AVEN_22567-1 [Araneus ventricosus]|uniref:Uncharacterized protein n=1 Tax=Araneus ventricosus TaxID=182803 RepID=A0A4Y2E504_ARAVE|nr:hypothetical protein AVEN_22567-1 [Araneus ventricosus]
MDAWQTDLLSTLAVSSALDTALVNTRQKILTRCFQMVDERLLMYLPLHVHYTCLNNCMRYSRRAMKCSLPSLLRKKCCQRWHLCLLPWTKQGGR